MNPEEEYTIKRFRLGVIISLPVQIDVLCDLMKIYKKIYGYDTVDQKIGEKLNGFCITSKYSLQEWRKELGIE